MKRNITSKLIMTALAVFSLGVSAQAGIVTVVNATNSASGSLRQSILTANAGDTIQFNSALNGSTILLTSGELVINKSLTIMGNGTANTIISGNNLGRVMNISNAGTVNIIGVKMVNGITLLSGGAMTISSSTVNIASSEISGNNAGVNGGAINNSGTLNISSTLIANNNANGTAASTGGGAIYNDGTLSIDDNSTLTSNTASGVSGSGGALFSAAGTVNITNSTLSSNAANRAGGAIEMINGSLTVTGSVITNNDVNGGAGTPNPGNGGAFHISGSSAAAIFDSTRVMANSAASEGGGLWNQAGSSLGVRNQTLVHGNTALGTSADNGGGGIFNNGGTLIVTGSTINSNMATGASGSGGGVFSTDGTVSISSSVIDSNSANRAGGAIEIIDGTLTVTNTAMAYNDVNGSAGTANPGNGGALHVTGMSSTMVTIDSCMVMFNEAASEGGGLWGQSGSTLTVTNGTMVRANIAAGAGADNGGGGIFNNGGTLNISNTTINANLATGTSGSGGAVLSTNGSVKVENSILDSNAANRAGGAIEVIDGTFDITATVMMYNDVNGTAGTANPGNGGALHVTGMSGTLVTINGGTVSNNSAAREGGGLWGQSGSTLTVSNRTTIDGNIAAGAATDDGGGGVFNNGGTLNISTATISNNSATGAAGTGGGILNISGGMMAIETSTISGNTSNAGAGIHNDGSMTITNSTITNNTAAIDGGGYAQMNSSNTVTITSSIVAGNTTTSGSGIDIYSSMGTTTSGGYNLIGQDDAGHFSAMSTDMEGSATAAIDAKLNVLADNGGGVETHSLQPSSPAINKGNPSDNSNDQRDSTVYSTGRDIGAFESRLFPESVGNVAIENLTSVTPNPTANGIINIEIPAQLTVTAVKVIDMSSGRLVFEQPMTSSSKVNLSSQPAGTYIVQIEAVEGVEAHKLVIMK